MPEEKPVKKDTFVSSQDVGGPVQKGRTQKRQNLIDRVATDTNKELKARRLYGDSWADKATDAQLEDIDKSEATGFDRRS